MNSRRPYTAEDLAADLARTSKAATMPAPYRPGRGRMIPAADMDYLRQHYADTPVRQLAARLGVSTAAVKNRWLRMGLVRPGPRHEWTAMEEDILRRMFAAAARADILAALPGRTWSACHIHGSYILGLTRPWRLGRG